MYPTAADVAFSDIPVNLLLLPMLLLQLAFPKFLLLLASLPNVVDDPSDTGVSTSFGVPVVVGVP